PCCAGCGLRRGSAARASPAGSPLSCRPSDCLRARVQARTGRTPDVRGSVAERWCRPAGTRYRRAAGGCCATLRSAPCPTDIRRSTRASPRPPPVSRGLPLGGAGAIGNVSTDTVETHLLRIGHLRAPVLPHLILHASSRSRRYRLPPRAGASSCLGRPKHVETTFDRLRRTER